MTRLTDYERQFADERHDIVYRFLRARRLSISEYYDVVIFRYLGAVQRYLSEPALRQYSFDTIACGAMRSALSHHFAAEKRKQEFCITSTDLVENVVACRRDVDEDTASKLLWLEVASYLTPSEKELVQQKAAGLTYAEIAPELGIAPKTAAGRMGRLRKRMQEQFDLDCLLPATV
jgi:RNA polymerase sigma-70 factor (ECF subfamily)